MRLTLMDPAKMREHANRGYGWVPGPNGKPLSPAQAKWVQDASAYEAELVAALKAKVEELGGSIKFGLDSQSDESAFVVRGKASYLDALYIYLSIVQGFAGLNPDLEELRITKNRYAMAFTYGVYVRGARLKKEPVGFIRYLMDTGNHLRDAHGIALDTQNGKRR